MLKRSICSVLNPSFWHKIICATEQKRYSDGCNARQAGDSTSTGSETRSLRLRRSRDRVVPRASEPNPRVYRDHFPSTCPKSQRRPVFACIAAAQSIWPIYILCAGRTEAIGAPAFAEFLGSGTNAACTGSDLCC